MDPSSLSTVGIAAGDAALLALPQTGGAIAELTWRRQPVLRPTPLALHADVRSCACYPLVPYSNRIRDAVLHFAGRTHRLARNFGTHPHAIHGVGWQRPWRVVMRTADTLQLALEHRADDDAARAAWPWSFAATQTLALSEREAGALLQATLTLQSRAEEAFPFGLGWHPFFPKDAATTLEFGAQGVWRNDATQLPLAREAIAPEWSFAHPRALDDLALDNVFVGWNGRAQLIQPSLGLRVALDADRACGNLVVYTPPRARFVALEPVTHETDAFNRAAAGALGTGMRVLPPGQAFSCTMRITVDAA